MKKPAERLSLTVPAEGVNLEADVYLPAETQGLVVFAHGSGSSRRSPRNRFVAEELNQGNIGTMLFDLLTEDEEIVDQRTTELRFNIPLLSQRLVAVTDWVAHQPGFARFPLGYFGASTGAAAALMAAAARPEKVKAVVSRGGRPDLAGSALGMVIAPTLLIVGGEDRVVLDLNETAMAQMPPGTKCELEVVPGATHLFEEPGALGQVARLARSWFLEHLVFRATA